MSVTLTHYVEHQQRSYVKTVPIMNTGSDKLSSVLSSVGG